MITLEELARIAWDADMRAMKRLCSIKDAERIAKAVAVAMLSDAVKEASDYGDACIVAAVSHGSNTATKHGVAASNAIADRLRSMLTAIEGEGK